MPGNTECRTVILSCQTLECHGRGPIQSVDLPDIWPEEAVPDASAVICIGCQILAMACIFRLVDSR